MKKTCDYQILNTGNWLHYTTRFSTLESIEFCLHYFCSKNKKGNLVSEIVKTSKLVYIFFRLIRKHFLLVHSLIQLWTSFRIIQFVLYIHLHLYWVYSSGENIICVKCVGEIFSFLILNCLFYFHSTIIVIFSFLPYLKVHVI